MEEFHPIPTGESSSGPHRPSRGSLLIGLALLFSLLALAVSCVVLVVVLFQEPEPEYITYRDQQLLVLEDVDRNTYDLSAFSSDTQGRIQYEKDGKRAAHGIDVSVYQGSIDWQAVADSGIEFAMIRLGYRGYSQGSLQLDECFQTNIEGALKAGLKVGVYFFSQATTVLEAEAEADFVLETIRSYPIQYPVVFDWEYITADSARTDHMTGKILPNVLLPSANWSLQQDTLPWSTSIRIWATWFTSWINWMRFLSGWRSMTVSRIFTTALRCGNILTPARCRALREMWT